MPTPPYASLRCSVNGGAKQSGAITAAIGDTVDLSAASYDGWARGRYEIRVPPGMALPSGWSDAGGDVYYYETTGGAAPQFSITVWGKIMPRLIVNNGASNNPTTIPPAQLTDKATAITVPSPSGLKDIGDQEEDQFAANWAVDQRANLRTLETALAQVSSGYSDEVTTTDATVTDIVTIPIPDERIVAIGARWLCVDQTSGDILFRESYFHYKRQSGGAPSLVGSVADLHYSRDDATHEATIAVDGNNIVLRGKGDATNDCAWTVKAWPVFEELSPPNATLHTSDGSGSTQTTDATETTVVTVPTATDKLYRFVVRWLGVESATGDMLMRDATFVYKNVGGTLSQVGTDNDILDYKAAGATAWAAAHEDDGGTNVLFRVTGEAAHTIDWICRVEYDTEDL